MVDNDADSEELVRSLLASQYRLLASVEQDETGRLATVRVGCPVGDENVVVDLLFANSGIEPEIARAAEMTEIVLGLSLQDAAGSRHTDPLPLPVRLAGPRPSAWKRTQQVKATRDARTAS